MCYFSSASAIALYEFVNLSQRIINLLNVLDSPPYCLILPLLDLKGSQLMIFVEFGMLYDALGLFVVNSLPKTLG